MPNLFQNPTYNGKFLSPNSAKPIAGVCTNTAYKRPLTQVKVSDTMIAIGSPVEITNKFSQSTAVNAGMDLAPNVMNASASKSNLDGFLVMSPNAILEDGDEFPKYLKNQVVHCALIGSGAELYLPADNSLVGKNVSKISLYWHKTDMTLKEGVGDSGSTGWGLGEVLILSQVVEGIMSYIDTGDNNKVKTKNIPVIKIKI